MADNIEDSIDQQMAQMSAPQGAPAPSPIEAHIDQQMTGQSNKEMTTAALEAAARGATFGLSDIAEQKLLGVPQEAIRGRKEAFQEEHPIASGAANVAGGAGTLLLTGGLAGPAEALVGGEGLAASALGAGAEGAAFGAGSAISDASLGDPNLNAQKVAADIGLGAILGAGLGAGAHGMSSVLGKSGSLKGSIADSIDSEGNAVARGSQSADDLINNGKTGMIKNADEILAAGRDWDVAPTNAMISSDGDKLLATDALLKGPPTAPAIRQKKIYSDIYNKIGSGLQDISPVMGDVSENDFGHMLSESLASHIEGEAEPYQQTYGALKQINENIPVPKSSLESTADEILDLKPVKQDFNAGYSQLARDVAAELKSGVIDNVDDFRAYQTRMNQRLGAFSSPGDKRVVGMIMDKLDELEKSTITKNANDFISKVDLTDPSQMATLGPQAQQLAQHLQDVNSADASYGPFREKINGLMSWLGKNKVSGPKDATAFIRNELEPEDIVRKLWSKKYAGLPQYLDKNFPEQAAMIKEYQKGQLQKAAMTDGVFDVRKFLKNINGMSKEQKAFLFFPDEVRKLASATKLMERFPKTFNFSNTDNQSAWRAFFTNTDGHIHLSGGHALGMAGANLRDYATEKFINRAVGTKTMTNRVDEKIVNNIEDILKTGSEGGF